MSDEAKSSKEVAENRAKLLDQYGADFVNSMTYLELRKWVYDKAVSTATVLSDELLESSIQALAKPKPKPEPKPKADNSAGDTLVAT